eukprot:13157853-Ditylum_brightwellii.AAC.1
MLNGKSINEALLDACMLIAATTTKLQKYYDRNKCLQNNHLFQQSHKDFYSSLRSKTNQVNNPPPAEEVDKFWRRLIRKESTHKENTWWLQEEEKSVEHANKGTWTDITIDELKKVSQHLKNWKAPGTAVSNT